MSLTLKNSDVYEGELLALSDPALFFKAKENLYEVSYTDIKKVYVHGFSVRDTKVAAMVPLIIIYGMMVKSLKNNEEY